MKTLFIEPGSAWENGHVESDYGKLSDEQLDGEVLDTLLEAKMLFDRWRERYNSVQPTEAGGSPAGAGGIPALDDGRPSCEPAPDVDSRSGRSANTGKWHQRRGQVIPDPSESW